MIIFLRLKNWQIFLLAFVFPLFGLIALVGLFDFGVYWTEVFIGFFIGWYYLIFILWNISVIRILNVKSKILSNRQLNWMKFSVVGLVLYGFYLVLPFSIKTGDYSIVRIMSPIFMIAGAFSIFYSAFCTAKTIKTLQYKEDTRTADIVIEMFVILYFAIGVLWVQRRVNRLIENLDD